jgi:hypothetical protein
MSYNQFGNNLFNCEVYIKYAEAVGVTNGQNSIITSNDQSVRRPSNIDGQFLQNTTNLSLPPAVSLPSNLRLNFNDDGTISAWVYNGLNWAPFPLNCSCCEQIISAYNIPNAFFNVETQTCNWTTKECNFKDEKFKIVLNANGYDGAIFSEVPDETCDLTISFDYLFKFNCDTLTKFITKQVESSCSTVLDLFESINAKLIIDVIETNQQIGLNLRSVYEQQVFSAIGSDNLYTYLESTSASTGFFVCGSLVNQNQNDTTCTPLNLYNPKLTIGQLDCSTFATTILENLYDQANLDKSSTTDRKKFESTISENAFNSDWLNFNVRITDEDILNQIRNEKIKISVVLSGNCIDTCVLFDNIKMESECVSVDKKSLYIAKSPGFDLDRIIDNKKSWVTTDQKEQRLFNILNIDNTKIIRDTDYFISNSNQIINTKEIDLDINIASAVETDVWYFISDNPCLLTGITPSTTTLVKTYGSYPNCTTKTYCGTETCGGTETDIEILFTQSLSGITTIEDFKYYTISQLIDAKNRQTISMYPTLKLLYERYLSSINYCSNVSSKFNYISMDQFANLIGTYWVDLIEQVIPATTIWGSTRIYSNTIFDTQKHKYKNGSLLFGNNNMGNLKFPSPVTGTSCNATATTITIQGKLSKNSTFIKWSNSSVYDNVYMVQMNSGSEFIGSVNIIGSNQGSGQNNDVIFINDCLIGVTISSVQPSPSASNGSATANVVGAQGNVTYTWSNGETTKTINNLSAGTYSVIVKDSKGCEAIDILHLIEK